MNIASAPIELLELLTEQQSARKPDNGDGGVLAPVGARNDTLFRRASGLRARGYGFEEICESLKENNRTLEEPLDEQELENIAGSAMRYSPNLDLSELGVAKEFASHADGIVKFTEVHGWLVYDEGRWTADPKGIRVQELVASFVDKLRDRVDGDWQLPKHEREDLQKFVARLRSRSKIDGIKQLAKSSPVLLDTNDWDEPSDLINFTNGTLDLSSMSLRSHDPDDRLLTRLSFDFDGEATCPAFDRVLNDALDPDTAEFLLRALGAALAGKGELQHLLFATGEGQNGKSTLFEGIGNALEGYSIAADPISFMKGQAKPGINNDVARMKGARLIRVPESNQGEILNASMIKRMTGGEKVVARGLYKEFEEFRMRALTVFVTNHLPVFDGSDFAMARRIVVVPFNNIIPREKCDPDLPDQIGAEKAGILNRFLQGYVRYKERGLPMSKVIEEATAKCLRDCNHVLQFLEEQCEQVEDAKTRSSELRNRYVMWCHEAGLKPMSATPFNRAVAANWSVHSSRQSAGVFWTGIKLKAL